MIVTVRLPAALAEHADGLRIVGVGVSDDPTVSEVVDRLGGHYPAVGRRIVDETGHLRRHVNVYVGNDECRRIGGLDAKVPPGAEIFVVGSIAGG